MKTIMMLGAGEQARELAISFKRLGCYVVACDKYDNAPAMQVSDARIVFDLLDGEALDYHASICKPDLIVPEVKGVNMPSLLRFDKMVVPNADALSITAYRDNLREFAVNECGIEVLDYMVVETEESILHDFNHTFERNKVIVRPVIGTIGTGQTVVEADDEDGLVEALHLALEVCPDDCQKVIVERFYNFDYEMTVLVTRTKRYGTLFSPAIVHRQHNGDFYISSQAEEIPSQVELKAREIADQITSKIGGYGVFAVDVFVKDNQVMFREVTPRPRDTGLVTLYTQNHSQYDLHARAILGLPIPSIELQSPGVCMPIITDFDGRYTYDISEALKISGVEVHMFCKRHAQVGHRVGIVLGPNEQIVTEGLGRIKVDQREATRITDFAT